jgi:putative chitinase
MATPGPTAQAVQPVKTLPLNLTQLNAIMRRAPAKYLSPLNLAMQRYDITTGKRVAAFLAQIAVESQELTHTHELWSSRKDFKLAGVKREAYTASNKEDYFKHWYGKRAGNTTDEDGYTYRGRGAIQITGKSNYIAIGNGIGEPLEKQPDLVETDARVDMLASAYYFAKLGHLNQVADGVQPDKPDSVTAVNRQLTQVVNGGANGINERLAYYNKALKLFCTTDTLTEADKNNFGYGMKCGFTPSNPPPKDVVAEQKKWAQRGSAATIKTALSATKGFDTKSRDRFLSRELILDNGQIYTQVYSALRAYDPKQTKAGALQLMTSAICELALF